MITPFIENSIDDDQGSAASMKPLSGLLVSLSIFYLFICDGHGVRGPNVAAIFFIFCYLCHCFRISAAIPISYAVNDKTVKANLITVGKNVAGPESSDSF